MRVSVEKLELYDYFCKWKNRFKQYINVWIIDEIICKINFWDEKIFL